MKVEINAGGRQVTVECGDTNVSYTEVADKALDVWKQTETGGPNPPSGYGFANQQAKLSDPSSSMRMAPGGPR